jgi:hypothetical protein
MAPRFVENLFAPVYKHQIITDVHKKCDSLLSVIYGTYKLQYWKKGSTSNVQYYGKYSNH